MLLRETLVLSYLTAYESGEADIEVYDAHSLQSLPLSSNQGQVMETVGSSLTQELPRLIGTPGHPSALKHTCFHWTWFISLPTGGGQVGGRWEGRQWPLLWRKALASK